MSYEAFRQAQRDKFEVNYKYNTASLHMVRKQQYDCVHSQRKKLEEHIL